MKYYRSFLLLVLSACLLASCRQTGRIEMLRSDYIAVYEVDSSLLVDNIQVPFEGAEAAVVNVLSNKNLDWRYQVSQSSDDPEWLSITDVETISLPGEGKIGHWKVTYDAKSILELNSLERREGFLSFSNSNAWLGKYLTMRQGYVMQYSNDFSKEGGRLVLNGKKTHTDTVAVVNTDYFDYISFNAYAKVDTEFLDENITVDVTIGGGPFFHNIGRNKYRVNVPVGTYASKENLRYLLISNGGELLSPKTTITFSVENQEGVTVYVDNLHVYKVSVAELMDIADDEEYDEREEWD